MNPKFTNIRPSITTLSHGEQLDIHRAVQARRLERKVTVYKAKKKKETTVRVNKLTKVVKKMTDIGEIDALITELKAEKAKRSIL